MLLALEILFPMKELVGSVEGRRTAGRAAERSLWGEFGGQTAVEIKWTKGSFNFPWFVEEN